jgi:hypothetical protein
VHCMNEWNGLGRNGNEDRTDISQRGIKIVGCLCVVVVLYYDAVVAS